MGWTNVPICDDHWIEEEGDRQAIRLVESLRDPEDRCYRCGRRTEGIYTRRNIPDAAGRITGACTRCGKEVSGETTNEAAVVVLGVTYDDVAVCIVFHADCFRQMDRIYVPPRKSDGMSLLDAIDSAVPPDLDDLYGHDEPDRDPINVAPPADCWDDQPDPDYPGSQPDRMEDA